MVATATQFCFSDHSYRATPREHVQPGSYAVTDCFSCWLYRRDTFAKVKSFRPGFPTALHARFSSALPDPVDRKCNPLHTEGHFDNGTSHTNFVSSLKIFEITHESIKSPISSAECLAFHPFSS